MKKIVAAAATAVLLCALVIATALQHGRAMKFDTPEACVNEMFEAMKVGDVPVYLKCFTGDLQRRLESTARDQTTSGFAEYLKQLVAPVRGRTLFQDKTEYSGPDQVRLVIDRVYENRPWEYQAYRLRRESSGWKIYAIEPVETHEPLIPHGAPAFPTAERPAETGNSAR